MYDASKAVPSNNRNVIDQEGQEVWFNNNGSRWMGHGHVVRVKHWREINAPEEPNTLTIPLPDGHEPDGEWPRCLRCPTLGETYINWYGNVVTKKVIRNGDPCGIILRPIKPPFDEAAWWARHPWIKAPWIACCSDGRWELLSKDAKPMSGGWGGGRNTLIDPKLVDFNPPPCPDWRKSKMKNPRCD